jgi:hypothetical protein
MSSSLEKIGALAANLAQAARKRKAIAATLKRRGFLALGKGAWLGRRGRDVVSGLLIEGSPSDTYISSFVLPIFDELKFVSWSLGRRIVHCSRDEVADIECSEAVRAYTIELYSIKSARDIIAYLDLSSIDGFYPLWVRYICYLRTENLDNARAYLSADRRSELHPSLLKQLTEIESYVTRGDVAGVAQVLDRWEATSRLIFGQSDFSLGSA